MELYGVPSGILYGQNKRVDELNDRIQSRQFPDKPLVAMIPSRPVLSKYSLFPILGNRPNTSNSHEPVESATPPFNVKTNFSPATRNGPPSGYYSNIDVETDLRNQTRRFGNKEEQTMFVPSSKSDLYHVPVPTTMTNDKKTETFQSSHPYLHSTSNGQFKTFREQRVNPNIGNDLFNNHTRTQLRSLN